MSICLHFKCLAVCLSLTVIVKLVNVLLVSIIYYPLFVCASQRRHLAANIAGMIYASLMLVNLAVHGLKVFFPNSLFHHLSPTDFSSVFSTV